MELQILAAYISHAHMTCLDVEVLLIATTVVKDHCPSDPSVVELQAKKYSFCWWQPLHASHHELQQLNISSKCPWCWILLVIFEHVHLFFRNGKKNYLLSHGWGCPRPPDDDDDDDDDDDEDEDEDEDDADRCWHHHHDCYLYLETQYQLPYSIALPLYRQHAFGPGLGPEAWRQGLRSKWIPRW